MKRSVGTTTLACVVAMLLAGVAHAKHPQSRVVSENTDAQKGAVTSVKQAQNTTQEEKTGKAGTNQAADQAVQADQKAQPQSEPKVTTEEKLEPTPEDKQRAVAAQQAATAAEQKLAAKVRGLQALMQKEEQALAQRLAYAAKIRAQGLAKNDQRLLKKAEQLERQSLDYYQRRVKQFETLQISSPDASSSNVRQPTRSTQPSSSHQGSRSSSQSWYHYRSGRYIRHHSRR